jgi:hypothetical protein
MPEGVAISTWTGERSSSLIADPMGRERESHNGKSIHLMTQRISPAMVAQSLFMGGRQIRRWRYAIAVSMIPFHMAMAEPSRYHGSRLPLEGDTSSNSQISVHQIHFLPLGQFLTSLSNSAEDVWV